MISNSENIEKYCFQDWIQTWYSSNGTFFIFRTSNLLNFFSEYIKVSQAIFNKFQLKKMEKSIFVWLFYSRPLIPSLMVVFFVANECFKINFMQKFLFLDANIQNMKNESFYSYFNVEIFDNKLMVFWMWLFLKYPYTIASIFIQTIDVEYYSMLIKTT